MVASRFKKIPYEQLVIGLDKLFFGRKLENQDQAEEQADTIDAYLEACGWNWDLVLEEICREETPRLQSKFHN